MPLPETKKQEAILRDVAGKLRANYADEYARLALEVQTELGLASAKISPESLGSIDTFPFEERALYTYCGELIATKAFDAALRVVTEREQSFWLARETDRRLRWEAYRHMAELGALATTIRATLPKNGSDPKVWVDAYAGKEGWHRLDRSQRRLEAWLTALEDGPEERPLGVVRQAYEEACHAMAEGFTKALVKASWVVPDALHQTKIYGEVVAGRPKPFAYFLVDAMRYEMGVELAERLSKTSEVSVRPALCALPSITPIGMAALLPEASRSFSVIAEKNRLGARIDGVFLPDLTARRKFAAARVPQLVDIGLDELLSLQPSKLAKKLEKAQVVIVRSQEIDHAGETGFPFQARSVMDTVIENLARAVRRLANAGVEHSVISADHGHLFFPQDRDESMRTDSPGGDKVELHRRCWIGRGGATPSGSVRVTATALGYESDLEFVFPTGAGVFKAGGDLAFHHGGPSLQELVIPVLTVRLKGHETKRLKLSSIGVSGLPEAVTNRVFSVTLTLDLVSEPLLVRPMLVSGGRLVGAVGMAKDAELDRATGCVTLQPAKPAIVAFLLSDENVSTLRVAVQDPATDADLYRSPADIPVRLGV